MTHRVLGHLPEQELDPTASEAVALLALVAGQDVEPAPDSDGRDGRWRIARTVAADRVISTVDPDTRHAHKTRARHQDGYKAHIVIEPDTGIITDTALTRAAGAHNSDAAVGIDLLTSSDTSSSTSTGTSTGTSSSASSSASTGTSSSTSTGTGTSSGGGGTGFEVLADSAYGTGDALAALAAAGHHPVIKPWPLRAAVPGGFTLDDFIIDEQTGTASCPNGVTRPITPTRNVIFGKACRGCPLRARCTTSKTGRSLTLHPHDALQRAHRSRATDPDFQTIYRRHRPMVERSIAWLVAGGNRRLRFRGTAANDLWLHHRVAGLNLRRLLTLGLHRTNGTWVLT